MTDLSTDFLGLSIDFPCPVCRKQMELHPSTKMDEANGANLIFMDQANGFQEVRLKVFFMRCVSCGAIVLRERPAALTEVHDS